MSDLNNFNSTFFLSLATMTFGFFGVALGYALKSKCSSVKCCCIEIIRDVELEADIEENTIQQQQPVALIDNIPNSQLSSRKSSVRRSYNLSTEAINALNNISTKEEVKEKTIEFSKSMI
jgi:hypothetical protein